MQFLKNIKVLVTRPKAQSSEFILRLNELGAIPIEFPLIQIEAINISRLREVYFYKKIDWIVFTSYNAVSTFFDVISPNEVSSKIAVIGPKTEAVLKKYNINADFIPSKSTAEILANEIPVLENETTFVPKSNVSENVLEEILRERRAEVVSVNTYRNTQIVYNQKEIDYLSNQKVDFITFTSGSTVRSFLSNGIPINQEKVICIGPETARVAKEHNINVTAIANPHTIEGIISAILESNN